MANTNMSPSRARNMSGFGAMNPSVLNQRMSRSGFVKTVGIGAAALGVSAARPARGSGSQPPVGRTFTIYPVGHSQFEKRISPDYDGQTSFELGSDIPADPSFAQVILFVGHDFTAEDGQTDFTLDRAPHDFWYPGSNVLVVEIDGVVTWDWMLEGNILKFFYPPSPGQKVHTQDHYYWYYPVNSRSESAGFFTIDGTTLTWNEAASGISLRPSDRLIVEAIYAPERFPADGQTVFNLTNASKNVGFTSVLVNGVQRTTGYTINGNTLTFTSGLNADSQVVVTYGDFDLLQETVNNAVDGDRIQLSDTNLARAPKKWAFIRAAGPGPVEFTTPAGTYDFLSLMEGADPRNGTAYRTLVISKGITIGKTPAGRKPTIANYLTEEDWNYMMKYVDMANPYSTIIVCGDGSGGAGRRPKFEDLKFERAYNNILALAPYVVDRCDFDKIYECVYHFPDNRITFPHLGDGDIDTKFSEMLTSEITNCTFTNITWAPINGQGSGFVFAHNQVSDCTGPWAVIQMNEALPGDTYAYWFTGIPGIMSQYGCFNRVFDNDFDGTNSPYYAFVVQQGRAGDFGAEAFNNSTNGNRFTNWGGVFVCTEIGRNWSSGGISYNNEASDNIFTNCVSCLKLLPDSSGITGALASGNTFIDVVPDSGPAVYIAASQNTVVVKNNYVQSGLPGWSPGFGCILLDVDVSNASVLEQNFPAATDKCDQILDLGSDNTISYPGFGRRQCGHPAPEVIQRLQQMRAQHQQKMQELGNRLNGKLGKWPGQFKRFRP